MVGQVREAVLLEEVHDRGVAVAQLAQLLLRETERVDDLVLLALVVVVDRLLEMMADADVVDDEALVLGLASRRG